MTPAQGNFVRWVKAHYPGLYTATLREIGAPPLTELDGLGTVMAPTPDYAMNFSTTATVPEAPSWIDQFGQAVEKIGAAVLTVKGQYDLLKINKDRALRGEDPISPSAAGVGVPVNVAADPGTVRTAGAALGAGIGVPLLALGVIAILMLRR